RGTGERHTARLGRRDYREHIPGRRRTGPGLLRPAGPRSRSRTCPRPGREVPTRRGAGGRRRRGGGRRRVAAIGRPRRPARCDNFDPRSPIMPDSFGARSTLRVGEREYEIFRLSALEEEAPAVARLPYSLRILLENLLRAEDG